MGMAQITFDEVGGSPSKVEKFEFTTTSTTHTLSIDFEPDVFVFYDNTLNASQAWLNPMFFGYSGNRQLAWWSTTSGSSDIGIGTSPTYNSSTKVFTFNVGSGRSYTALAIKYVE